jgi:hypothetical protein
MLSWKLQCEWVGELWLGVVYLILIRHVSCVQDFYVYILLQSLQLPIEDFASVVFVLNMDFAPTMANPLHRSVDNSFVVDTFTNLSCFFPIMSKTAISQVSIDEPNRHPITELMISFAKLKNSEINSQETTTCTVEARTFKSPIETVRYSVLSALFYSYQKRYHLAKRACNTTELYFKSLSNHHIQQTPELLTLLWSHTLLVMYEP